MRAPNYVVLHLGALAAASAASLLACLQGQAGNHHLAHKARQLADRRRAEAEFFSTVRFIP